MRIHRIIQSCFSIELKGKILYFDPFRIPKDSEKADVILITHPHYDHYSKSSMHVIMKDNTVVICPKSCKKIMNKWNARGLRPGEQTKINDIDISAVPAYTKIFHNKKLFNWLGYVIDDGNQKIYHAGDTYYIPAMKELTKIDYAFLPIGGFYTMGFKGALKTAKTINARYIIPMHERKKDLKEFKDLLEKSYPHIKVIVLQKNCSHLIEEN